MPKTDYYAKKKVGMEHLNSNLLCAIDIEVTGDDPFHHDICEITIIPIDYNIERMRNADFFHAEISPRHKDRIDPETMSVSREKLLTISNHGLDSVSAEAALEKWFDDLNLGPNKQIMPIAFQWYRIYPYIRRWLGRLTYDYIFHENCRDIQSVSLFNNDYYYHHIEPVPFAKNDFSYLCSASKTLREPIRYRDTMTDCLTIIELYKKMCGDGCMIKNT